MPVPEKPRKPGWQKALWIVGGILGGIILLGAITGAIQAGMKQGSGPSGKGSVPHAGPTTTVVADNQRLQLASDGHWEIPLNITSAAAIQWTVFEREQGKVDVCIFQQSEMTFWTGRSSTGWKDVDGQCSKEVHQASGRATANPSNDTWYFGIRCDNFADPCDLTYSLSITQ